MNHMYSINKIAGFVASPIGVAILGMVCALISAKMKRTLLAKWLGCLTVVWLWLWMTPIMTWVVGVPLEREFLVDGRVPMIETFPEADAIVLLGGSMGAETNLSSYAEMWPSADRVWQAARLYRAGKASKIIATGNGAVDTTLPLLLDFGVAKDDVRFVDAANTEGEAKVVDGLVRGGVGELRVGEPNSHTHPLKNSSNARPTVLLVTSAWHMKRARLMFEKYAPSVEVVCAPADFENSIVAARPFSLSDFLPDPGVFIGNSVALHEWVGIIGYRLFR